MAGELFVWLSRNPAGGEGVMVAPLAARPGFYFSLVFQHEAQAREHLPFAREHTEETGDPAWLVKFTRSETVAEVRLGMLRDCLGPHLNWPRWRPGSSKRRRVPHPALTGASSAWPGSMLNGTSGAP